MLISRWLRDMVRDLFHSLRAMLCSAWSTAFAILLAAIVIGFTSAVLSLAKTRFLNPFQDPGKLVLISKRGPNGEDKGTQAEYYSDLYTENKSFSDLAGWSRYSRAGDSKLTGSGSPELPASIAVTRNFFRLTGVELFGRSFLPESYEGRDFGPLEIIVSDTFGKRHFGPNTVPVGPDTVWNGKPAIVVGVLPQSFDFASTFASGSKADVFIPWPQREEKWPPGHTVNVVGRLNPGVS